MSTAERLSLSEDEYLEFDRTAEMKHEFVNGEIVAMSGASPRHNRIVTNLIASLENRLGAGPCGPLPGDQRVHVPGTGMYAYPDVTVLCGRGEYHPKDRLTLLNPRVIFEVLSDSTAAYDRGAKFDHFRRLTTLAEYVLVAQREQVVLHFRRADAGQWVLTEYPPGDAVKLPALGIELPLTEIYRRVDEFPAD